MIVTYIVPQKFGAIYMALQTTIFAISISINAPLLNIDQYVGLKYIAYCNNTHLYTIVLHTQVHWVNRDSLVHEDPMV